MFESLFNCDERHFISEKDCSLEAKIRVNMLVRTKSIIVLQTVLQQFKLNFHSFKAEITGNMYIM